MDKQPPCVFATNKTLRHGFQQNGGEEEVQRRNLNRPRLRVRAVELAVHKHAQQRRHQQRATTQRVADGKSQLRARRRVAPVAERQEERGPDGYL